MKKWPWKMILVCVGWLLVVAGVTPGAYILVRLGNAHNQEPLSVPVTLKQGAFTSPYFTTGSGGDYQIDLNWDMIPARQTAVDLDWKIVTDNGSVVEQGTINSVLRGANAITLGSYNPPAGQREQILLDVHEDVDQGGAHAKLEIGPQDISAGLSQAIPFAAGWAVFVAGPGAILLIALAILGAKRRKAAAVKA
ncbi:MAG: hypothetical protein WA802_13100 [Terracidiphilus sp.]